MPVPAAGGRWRTACHVGAHSRYPPIGDGERRWWGKPGAGSVVWTSEGGPLACPPRGSPGGGPGQVSFAGRLACLGQVRHLGVTPPGGGGVPIGASGSQRDSL